MSAFGLGGGTSVPLLWPNRPIFLYKIHDDGPKATTGCDDTINA